MLLSDRVGKILSRMMYSNDFATRGECDPTVASCGQRVLALALVDRDNRARLEGRRDALKCHNGVKDVAQPPPKEGTTIGQV